MQISRSFLWLIGAEAFIRDLSSSYSSDLTGNILRDKVYYITNIYFFSSVNIFSKDFFIFTLQSILEYKQFILNFRDKCIQPCPSKYV